MKAIVHALAGIWAVLRRERNMRIHLCFAFYVVVFGAICALTPGEWTACLLCIGAVTALECLNTALETLCDKVHPERSSAIGLVKDAAAGAVLCMAAAAFAVGGVVFFRGDKLSRVFDFLRTFPAAAVMLAVTVPVWIIYIIGRRNK